MAVKGSKFKEFVANAILDTFEGSFINDKEIRICGRENGEEMQIKVTLTLAKVNVTPPSTVTTAPKKAEKKSAALGDTMDLLTEEEKVAIQAFKASLS